MATDKFLKFYKGGNQPTELGSIWFNNGLLSVVSKEGEGVTGTEAALEYFSGVRDAEWTVGEVTEEGKTYVKKVLSLTKADGTKVELDFSDVASAQVLGALRANLDDLVATVTSNKKAADDGIQEAKDAAADALAAAGTAESNAKGYTDQVVGVYASEGVEASGLRKEIAERDAAVEGKVTALGQTVSSHDDAIKDIQEELEGLNGGAGSIATQIDNAIKELNNNGVEGEGDYVKVTVTQVEGIVTDVAVVEDLSAITEAISSEAETARAAEKANADAIAAEKARIDALVGEKDDEGNFVDAGKSVRAIAAEEVAEIVAGADEAYDTLKEIADWIANHPEDAAGYNERIVANATAIENITKENGAIDTAVANAKTEIVGTLAEGDAATLEAINDELDVIGGEISGLKGLVGTTSVDSQIKAVTDPISDRVLAVENKLADVDDTVGKEIEDALSAYSTTEQMNTALAGKVDNDTFTTYQGTVNTALEGKAAVADVQKNAQDIADIKSALCWERFE